MLIKLGALMAVFIALWIVARMRRREPAAPPPAEAPPLGAPVRRTPKAGAGAVALKEPEDE